MENPENVTISEAVRQIGLSQGRISQLIHGYEHKDRGERYLPVLKEDVHWRHETRGRRVYTVITPEGMEILRRVKSGETRQEKGIVE